MDRLSLIFSLLLIVSVITTTFGSAIKGNNRNGEDLEALFKRSHNAVAELQGPKNLEDQDSEKFKRVGAGAIIPGAMLSVNLLQTLLYDLADVECKCAVGIDNESKLRWKQGSKHFVSGGADENLPDSLDDGLAVLYGPRQTPGVPAGVRGVVAYYIPSIDTTLAVMFYVPFDSDLYENWWNAKLYPGNQRANRDQYRDLYYDADPFRANGWHQRYLGYGLKFRGSMSNSGKATLEIHVLKE